MKTSEIYGGYSTSGNANSNEVIITNSSLTVYKQSPFAGSVYGGKSDGGKEANNNKVTIISSYINDEIFGGYSNNAGKANGNR